MNKSGSLLIRWLIVISLLCMILLVKDKEVTTNHPESPAITLDR